MRTHKPVNWGILGASNFARKHMAPAIHAASDAKLTGLATSAVEKAAPFRAFAPDLQVFDSYDALLGSDEIDAVYIPLPNHMHVEWTLRALEAGKAVLTEKPIAMSETAFDELIAARDSSGLLAAEAYMIVHHPQWQRAKALYEEGAIGDLILVDGVFSYDNSGDPQNIRNKPETGGGSLPDIGVYTIGSARFVTGEEPSALSATIRWENDVDVFAHAVGEFPSFRFSSVTSMRMHPRQSMTFHGTEGVMHLSAPFNPLAFGQAELHLSCGQSVTTQRWPGDNHYVNQVEAFGAAMRGETDYPCPLEFSRGTQRALDMIFASAGG